MPVRQIKRAKLVHDWLGADHDLSHARKFHGAIPTSRIEDDLARSSAHGPAGGLTEAGPSLQQRCLDSPGRRTPLRRFEFEKLPAEVRSMIYGYLFIKDHSIRPLCQEERYFEAPGSSQRPGLGPGISLLRTSRSISCEASDVLYGRNHLLLYGLDFGDSVLEFLRRIGSTNCHAIRRLSIDWQHGIVKINQASRAADLLAMISDKNNPLRVHLRKMLHDVGRTTILKFVATLELLIDSPRLQHLTIVCPGNENPGHPDNHCTEFHGCAGCHHEVPKVLVKIKGLKSLTVGDTDWHNELEILAAAMGTEVLSVTQVDCIELPEESALDLEQQGWSVKVTWRVPDGNHFRRVVTKRLRTSEGKLLRDDPDSIKRQWW